MSCYGVEFSSVCLHTKNNNECVCGGVGTSSLPLWAISQLGPWVINLYPLKKAIEFGVSKMPNPTETKVRGRGGGRIWVNLEIGKMET